MLSLNLLTASDCRSTLVKTAIGLSLALLPPCGVPSLLKAWQRDDGYPPAN